MNQTVSLKASLPMYDWPELSSQKDELWHMIASIIAKHDLQPPERLDRNLSMWEMWQHTDCVFSQTCGWPYAESVNKYADLLVTPVYTEDGCKGMLNSSRIVCRADDTRKTLADFHQSTVAINGEDSQSGYHAMRSALVTDNLPAPFFARQLVSGAHRETIKRIVEGDADIGAIDPVSWALCKQFETRVTDNLRVIGQGPYTPGLPYIINKSLLSEQERQLLSQELQTLLQNLPEDLAKDLMIADAVPCNTADYDIFNQYNSASNKAGHTRLIAT